MNKNRPVSPAYYSYGNAPGMVVRESSPSERMRDFGPKSLSNSELLALLLWTGLEREDVFTLASRMLARLGGLAGLEKATFEELCEAIPAGRGMSQAKACQVLAALELGRRMASLAPQERVAIQSPRDVANLVMTEMGRLEQEHLRVLLLNTKHQVMSIQEIYVGSVNATVVRPAEIFRPAVRENATAIIVVHNHPSGDPAPSAEDISITRALVQSGRALEIELLDHVIIGSVNRYLSLKEKGLGFD